MLSYDAAIAIYNRSLPAILVLRRRGWWLWKAVECLISLDFVLLRNEGPGLEKLTASKYCN